MVGTLLCAERFTLTSESEDILLAFSFRSNAESIPMRAAHTDCICVTPICFRLRFTSTLRDQQLSASVQRFVAQSVILFSALAVSSRIANAQATNVRLRIGLIVPASPSPLALSVARGARLGAAESKRTAALFGGDVQLYDIAASGQAALNVAAVQMLSRGKVHVLISAAAEDVDALSRFAEEHNLIFMNAASRRGSLRSACRRHTFHVEAPDVAYQNALALGRRQIAEPRGIPRTGAASDPVVLWSGALVRFGASQINARYRAMFNTDMDAGAWAGWIAVKIAAEAALRAGSAQPKSLITYLEASSTQFDGHKGWPLTFRRADHQLRQPLYIVAASGTARRGNASSIQDVPDIGQLSSGMQEPSTLLDRLNARPGNRACGWLPL
jgi:ABC-type branched-subunit amino acid transport system substrate-binding protein